MPIIDDPPIPHLREIRIKRALTQADLSALTGITQASISKLENGRRSAHLSTVRLLAQVLDVSPVDLMGEPQTT